VRERRPCQRLASRRAIAQLASELGDGARLCKCATALRVERQVAYQSCHVFFRADGALPGATARWHAGRGGRCMAIRCMRSDACWAGRQMHEIRCRWVHSDALSVHSGAIRCTVLKRCQSAPPLRDRTLAWRQAPARQPPGWRCCGPRGPPGWLPPRPWPPPCRSQTERPGAG
jgi:hypothetical protein